MASSITWILFLLENQRILMLRCLLPRCCQQIFLTAICSIHMLMSVQRFIRIERASEGAHDLKLKKVPLFARKPVNIIVLWSASTKLALVPANPYNCDIKYSYVNVCAKFH